MASQRNEECISKNRHRLFGGGFFCCKARQAADELARLTSAGRKDMEHNVRNVRLRVE